MNTIKTYGDFIKANPDDEGAKRLKAAIEGDKRKRAESERLHPLSGHTTTEFRPDVPAKHIDTSAVAINYPINPTA